MCEARPVLAAATPPRRRSTGWRWPAAVVPFRAGDHGDQSPRVSLPSASGAPLHSVHPVTTPRPRLRTRVQAEWRSMAERKDSRGRGPCRQRSSALPPSRWPSECRRRDVCFLLFLMKQWQGTGEGGGGQTLNDRCPRPLRRGDMDPRLGAVRVALRDGSAYLPRRPVTQPRRPPIASARARGKGTAGRAPAKWVFKRCTYKTYNLSWTIGNRHYARRSPGPIPSAYLVRLRE